MTSRPKLLVIGAGFAGVTMASKCSSFCDVTLIDTKGYFEITWASVRGIVNEKFAQRTVADLSAIPNVGKVLVAAVTRLTAKEAHLSDGTVLPFDYCAVCSGSTYSDAFKSSAATTREQRLAELKSLASELKGAKHVVVVGGGPAGVEVAAEVVNAYAGKQVTLVAPGACLLPAMHSKGGNRARTWLEAHGVKVLLGQRVESAPAGHGPATLALSGGGSLSADLVLWCTGQRPNTAFMAPDLAASVDKHGAVKVGASLQVEGQPHLFALGDCNNVPEVKKGFLAQKQAEMAAASLKSIIDGKATGKAPKLGSWKPSMGFEMMMVSLADADGVCQMGSGVCCSWLVSRIKGKDLFVGPTRKGLGLPDAA